MSANPFTVLGAALLGFAAGGACMRLLADRVMRADRAMLRNLQRYYNDLHRRKAVIK